jgi:hypothetical protein
MAPAMESRLLTDRGNFIDQVFASKLQHILIGKAQGSRLKFQEKEEGRS